MTGRAHCPGCGALVPDLDGPTHAYVGASPGCWKIYGDVLAREYGELRNPPYHRMTVDAYAAQHPGVESRRSVQSVAGHLIALHLVLERGLDTGYATKVLGRITQVADRFVWLTPPDFSESMTVLDVAAAATPGDHERAVRAWASSVWEAWRDEHETVREWARLLG